MKRDIRMDDFLELLYYLMENWKVFPLSLNPSLSTYRVHIHIYIHTYTYTHTFV